MEVEGSGLDLFQSAPLTEARGDLSRRKFRSDFSCFNPLPSPKQGETAILKPEEIAERPFQSAPLTEARGDKNGRHNVR